MRVLKPRTHHHHVEHRLVFERPGSGGSEFSFPCAPDGNVDTASLPAAARDNFHRVSLAGLAFVRSVLECVHDYTEPAIGECEQCEGEVVLSGFTNTCQLCGADYNMSGHLLAPRERWGEETGETAADVVSVDAASTDALLGV
jgi:hypothetical protein